ncbi:tRNA uridine 5-carboxymethylaminomethyl modification enzyme GidA, partial [Ancylostoma duodenale]
EISSTRNLDIVEGNVEALSTGESNGESRVSGVTLDDGTKLRAKAVVIATGTFLGGEIFLGKRRWPAGRIGEKSSIDFSKFERMPPDEEPIPFSFMTDRVWLPPDKQLPTYLGYTNDSVRDIVEENLADNDHVKAEASGPRYCPSLESK